MSRIDDLLSQIEAEQASSDPSEADAHPSALDPERARQFRLSRIQLKDWGTYHGLLTLDVPAKGQLFVGHSGSGKSTIFDAHSVLLTPPQRLRLNQASRDNGKASDDRSVINYVRGVWGTAQGEDGRGVAKVLRSGTTWSAIAEVYRNGAGKLVTVAHLYWLRGASTDLHRRYLVAESEFDLRALDFFAEADFDTTRLHRTLRSAGVEPFDSFSRYMASFTKLLGIRDEMALLLLHKTQSSKSVDSITAFLREFMLEEPGTFGVAKDVVNQFHKLNEAHADWVTATEQCDVLMPAREANQRLHALAIEHGRCEEIAAGVSLFATALGLEVHDRAILAAGPRLEAMKALLETRHQALKVAESRHAEAIRDEARGGGDRLRQLDELLATARARVQDAGAQCQTLEGACAVLKQALPGDEAAFSQLYALATGIVDKGAKLDTRRFQEAVAKQSVLKGPQGVAQAQLAALAKQPRSNVPPEQQDIRSMLAEALDVGVEALPFAAELMSVRPQDKRWQGALERLMGGFGVTMLVAPDLFDDLRRIVDRKHLRGRLTYRPVRHVTETVRARLPENAASKIDVADHEFNRWLVTEIHRQFDYACVESADDMSAHPRALTMRGQIKRAGENYLKDDRSSIDDSTRWVLGTDTASRAEAVHKQLENINQQMSEAQAVIDAHEREAEQVGQRLQAAVAIRGLSWDQMDEAAALAEVRRLEQQVASEQKASPGLEQLRAELHAALGAKNAAQKHWADQHGLVASEDLQLKKWATERSRLAALPIVQLTPLQQVAVDEMRERRASDSTPENYDRELAWLRDEANKALRANEAAQTAEKGVIVQALAVFCARTEWKAATKGHDPVLDSFDFFDQHLTNLLMEGVSRTWERFLKELQEHNSHQLTLLSQSLSSERADMAKRLLAVNNSLERTPYNPGTHLFLHRVDCEPEESKTFRRDLTIAMSEVVNVDTAASAQVRFDRLRAIAERLGSDKSEDIRWRGRVLDVRQHVQFDAHEIVDATKQVEQVYSGSDGKSGGQKQKLAATCMAAALRYQLANPGATIPQFATVVVDEAFDRSDPDFTEAALNVFRELGFQIIVATPGKMVQTIEPYVGGAVWVYAKRGDRSNAVPLRYDEALGRIDYSPIADDKMKADRAFAA